MNIYFKTFGCRTNIYDTDLMKSITKEKVVNSEEDADIIVINSCSVTNSADTTLKHYINKYQNKKLLLTGCCAYTIGEKLYQQKRVFGVFGHSEKENIDKMLSIPTPFYKLGNLEFINKNIITSLKRSRAFIKIQEGCDFECGYCIIPFVRGKSRSIAEDTIIKQIEVLAQNGFSEFILTGINMGSYGKDTNTNLAKLLDKIFKIDRIKRVRLGSLEPSQITEEFLEILSNPILERHLHIALQYADDRMLRIMKRRNRVKQTLALFEKLAQMGFAIGTDYIVGHPGESEDIFQSGFENLKKFPLTHIHLFRYSPRDNTYSATLNNNIKNSTIKDRYNLIKQLIQKKNYTFRLQKQPLKVLVEEYKNGFYQGFDQFFNKILIKSQLDLTHQWVDIDEYEVKEVNYAKK
jgi:MiaB-like tRNA modifying enzyme